MCIDIEVLVAVSRDKNAGRRHSIMIDNSSFKSVEQFKNLGTTVTNRNSIQEELKGRLKSGNACCHSVKNLLSSSLLSKNLKINLLTPNVNYSGRTAPLTSKVAFYIFIQQI